MKKYSPKVKDGMQKRNISELLSPETEVALMNATVSGKLFSHLSWTWGQTIP